MKRRPFSLLAACLVLPALLGACVPSALRTQSGAAVKLSAQLFGGSQVADHEFRRSGPSQLQVQASGLQPETYLYALLLPEQTSTPLTSTVLIPAVQPLVRDQFTSFNLPPVLGYTQVFVVGSSKPLTFGPLGTTVSSLAQAVNTATAALPKGAWNVVTQVYRVGDYGGLSVFSTPSDANVYLNNTYKGRTPLMLDALPAGQLTLRLEHEHYQTLSKTMNVVTDQTLKVSADLQYQPSQGRLSVSSSVPARVQVLGRNNSLRVSTPFSSKLLAGDYDLTITPTNLALKPAWLGITLKSDQTLDISCSLDGAALDCQTS